MDVDRRFLTIVVSLVLLVSTFSVGLAFSADGVEDEEKGRVLLVQKRGIDTETLKDKADISVITDYEEYVLVRATSKAEDELTAQGYILEDLKDRDLVSLHSTSFKVSEGLPEIPGNLKVDSYPKGVKRPHIVQFIGPIKPEWRTELQDMGVVLHEYRHSYNFIVGMSQKTAERVESLDFVDWTGIYQPGYKFEHQLLNKKDIADVSVNTFSTANTAAIAKNIISLDGKIYSMKKDQITTRLRTEHVRYLANLPDVKSITPANLDHQLFNHDATWVTQTNRSEDRKVTEKGVTGTGQMVTVMDSELYMDNGGHEMWKDPNGNPIGDNHRKVQAHYVPSGSSADLGEGTYHGSHVSGTVLGDAPPYGSYNNQDGHGMGARLIHQDIGQSGGGLSAPSDMYNDAWLDSYNRGSRIHTNSWGSSGARGAGSYTGEAVTTDEFIWDHQNYSILWAAGNDGSNNQTISPQGHSKNAITVGASGNAPIQEDVPDFSSRGYANDGRIKPTLLGVGLGVTSSNRSSDGYSGMSGTSMATPGIAGQTSQVREYYKRGWYPTGKRNQEDSFDPSSALVKATLVNGAEEISGDGAYLNDNRFPNGDQGFGRSNMDRSLYFEWDERKTRIFDSWNEGVELSTGENWNLEFDVEDTSMPLEATLVWNDYPGADGANPAIVNDLDLEMTGPTGTRYVGNAFTGHNPGYSAPDPTSNPWNGDRSGEWDGLNVVEDMLLLPDENGVEKGTYNLTVNANNVPNGPQPFAVVISGGISPVMEDGEPPQITIDTPNGGETWNEGTQQDITWTTTAGSDPIKRIDLRYTIDGGNTWKPLASNLSTTGSYTWTVPNHHSTECLVKGRVLDQADRYTYDTSDNTFEIVGSPPGSTSKLDVVRGGGPTMVPFDNFSDGDYTSDPKWTVNDGSWNVTNNYLEGNGVISTEAVLDNNSIGAYGRWEWDFQFETLEADGDTYQLMRFDFIQSSNDPTSPTGYYILLSGDTPGGAQVNLWAIENGEPPDDAPLISGNWVADLDWHTLAVERDQNNEFAVYVDGNLIGTAQDDRYTSSQYLGLRHDANPLGSPHNVDEVRVQKVLTNDEHNHVSWAASPDDPAEVSHYNVYRSDQKASNYQKIGSVEANGSATYKYVDEYKGKVDNTYWWYRSRAVGVNGLEEGNTIEKQEPGAPLSQFNISLQTGWNFVSFNLASLDNDLTAILDDPDNGIQGNYDKVTYYDSVNEQWVSYIPGRSEHYNDIGTWDNTMGIWIRMTQDDILTIEGTEVTTTEITLQPGWNMIGMPTASADTGQNLNLTTEVSKVGYFNGSSQNNVAYDQDPQNFEFAPGEGYWVYNDAETTVTWTIEY